MEIGLHIESIRHGHSSEDLKKNNCLHKFKDQDCVLADKLDPLKHSDEQH